MYKLIDGKFYELKEVSNEYMLELLNNPSINNPLGMTSCDELEKRLELEDDDLGKPTCPDIKYNPWKVL